MEQCQAIITVQQQGDALICTMNFRNVSRQPLYLNKIDICLDGELSSKVFKVERQGIPVAYTGVMLKRGPKSEADFVEVPPQEQIQTSARVDTDYSFPAGRHRFTIQYSHYHSSPKEKSLLQKIESNTVVFEFDKR